jgi:hypothetical protein
LWALRHPRPVVKGKMSRGAPERFFPPPETLGQSRSCLGVQPRLIQKDGQTPQYRPPHVSQGCDG